MSDDDQDETENQKALDALLHTNPLIDPKNPKRFTWDVTMRLLYGRLNHDLLPDRIEDQEKIVELVAAAEAAWEVMEGGAEGNQRDRLKNAIAAMKDRP